MLPLEKFKTVIANTPLISIDLIVRNSQQQVLLGKRLNRPAQDYWFVPGGRILKDESIEGAFKRLLKTELGIEAKGIKTDNCKFNGIYQHFYEDNVNGFDFSTHYVVMAYEIEFDGCLAGLPKEQHDNYEWFSEESILKVSSVHKHTKWYFQKGQTADAFFDK